MNFSKNIIFFISCLVLVASSSTEAAVKVPSEIISMGGRNKVAIVVEKSSQKMFVYRYDGEYHEDMAVRCSTGKLAGRKELSGDQKTPEGVYFFTGKYFQKDLSPVYGALAFPVDYPNQIDKEVGRTGYAIWLHGTDRELMPRDSNGCVALENSNLKTVEKLIELDYTPIIFVDEIEYRAPDTQPEIKKQVHSLLKSWAKSLQAGSYHDYLSWYSPEYAPDIRWWNTWQRLRNIVGDSLSVILKSLSIYKDGDLYVIIFEENLRYDGADKRVGVKKMYLSTEDGGLKIRGEKYKFIHYAENKKSAEPKEPPVLSAINAVIERRKLKKQVALKKHIKSRILKWASLWSEGNIKAYAGYYSNAFASSGMDKAAWVNRKKYLGSTYKYINVNISDLNVAPGESRVIVSFNQDYKSSGYSATGHKTIVMVNEDEEWKIIQEIWKKS